MLSDNRLNTHTLVTTPSTHSKNNTVTQTPYALFGLTLLVLFFICRALLQKVFGLDSSYWTASLVESAGIVNN